MVITAQCVTSKEERLAQGNKKLFLKILHDTKFSYHLVGRNDIKTAGLEFILISQ